MGQYTTNEELAGLIRDWQSTDVLPGRLFGLVGSIVVGVRARHGRTVRAYYRVEDHAQDVWVKLVEMRDRIDLEGNLFSLITTVAINFILHAGRSCGKWAFLSAGSDDGRHDMGRACMHDKRKPYWINPK